MADESLVSYRVEATDPKRWGHTLHSDESKWQDVEIFPVTVSDQNGEKFQLTIDSRPESIN